MFKEGDLALVIKSVKGAEGSTAFIISDRKWLKKLSHGNYKHPPCFGYVVKVDGRKTCAPEQWLMPLNKTANTETREAKAAV